MGSPKKVARRSIGGATGAGATTSTASPRTSSSSSSKASASGQDGGRLGLAGTLWGATLAAVLGYLVGYFFRNEHTSPAETTRKLFNILNGGAASVGGLFGLLPGSGSAAAVTGPSLSGCAITALLADEMVPGMHLACVQRTPSGLHATVFMDGRNASGTGPLALTAAAEDFQALRAELQARLELAPEGRRHAVGPRGMETPNTFMPWAMYTPQGRAVESLLDLQHGANDVLLFEGGRFIWPGVREGHVTHVEDVDGLGGVSMRTLSMSPLVFSVEGFLRKEECAHIRERAEPHMAQSGVSLMDHDKGKAATDWRTSSTHFLASREDPTLQTIDRRVADLTRMPVQFQEDVQVLRYDKTQRYDAHHDFFNAKLYAADPNTINLIQNGRRNRMITVLWYLSDVARGGETIFPMYKKEPHMISHDTKDCDRIHGGLRAPPKQGSVIMFYSLLPNGDLDDKSLHGSCAVKEGTKWAANKWIWNKDVEAYMRR